MAANRAKVEKFIIDHIDRIASGGQNKKLYQDMFKKMSDAEFKKYMTDLQSGKTILSIVVPHDNSVKVDVKNNLDIAKSLGYEFFQHLNVEDPITKDKYITPNKYLVYRLPMKRTAQLLTKGISVPKDARSTDMITGQVAGSSKSGTLTMPEIQMLVGMGMERTVVELLKYRGGDLGAKNAMLNILYKQGRVDHATLDSYSTGVESTKTLKTYLLGAHIRSEGLDNK